MASAAVTSAFLARLAANWTATPVAPINGSADAAKDGSAFLTVEFPVSNEDQISLGAAGANTFRETGACRFVLSIPIGDADGFPVWLAKIDALRTVFRGQFFDGITTWAASPPATNDASDDGAYFNLSFAVPYQHDVFA